MSKKNKVIKKESLNVKKVESRYFYLILVVLPLLLYFHSINDAYTSMDDVQIIKNHPAFFKNINNVAEAFKVDAFIEKEGGVLYRPLQTITYILDYQLVQSEDSLAPFHITNIILHLLIILLLFNMLLQMKINRLIAFLLVLLYSVHPLLTAAVVWIPARGDLLLTFFALVSVISFFKYSEDKKPYFILIHCIAFFLALLSKETALVLPVAILSSGMVVHKIKMFSRNNYIFFGLWGAEIIIFMTLRISGLHGSTFPTATFGIKPFIENLQVIPITAGKFFIPHDLTTYAMFKVSSVICGIVIIVGVVYLLYKDTERRLASMIGLLWFLVFTIPPMLFRQPFAAYGMDYLEHRAYLPLIGLLMFTTMLVNQFVMRKIAKQKQGIEKEPKTILLYAGITLFFIYSSNSHSSDFKDRISFSNAAIESCDRNAIAYNDRAVIRNEEGRSADAFADLNKSIGLCAINPQAFNNRGVIYLNANQPGKAYDDLSKAIGLDKNYLNAFLTRGVAEIKLNKYTDAIADFSVILKKESPLTAAAYFNRAFTYEQVNDFRSALSDYEAVVQREPGNQEVIHKIQELRGKLSEQK